MQWFITKFRFLFFVKWFETKFWIFSVSPSEANPSKETIPICRVPEWTVWFRPVSRMKQDIIAVGGHSVWYLGWTKSDWASYRIEGSGGRHYVRYRIKHFTDIRHLNWNVRDVTISLSMSMSMSVPIFIEHKHEHKHEHEHEHDHE